MSREERFAEVLGAVPESCRGTLEPVLRLLIHDLNGPLSAVTMEAFAIGQLAASLSEAGAGRRTDEHARQLESLLDAARNLRQAADGAASYLAQVESLTDHLGVGE